MDVTMNNSSGLLAVLCVAALGSCAAAQGPASAPAPAEDAVPVPGDTKWVFVNGQWQKVVATAPGAPAAAAQPAPVSPASAAATATATGPAATPASTQATPADPNALRILQALEATRQKFATLEADVSYLVHMRMEGIRELRTGRVAFAWATAKTPDMFYIRFDTLKQNEGSTFEEKEEYAFDGQWFSEAKHKVKTLNRWQVVGPGQKANPLKLGQGPFPVPFGQSTEDVLKYFEPATRPPKASDPNGTEYIRLATRPIYKDEMEFLTMEMWVDGATHLPVKIVTTDKDKRVKTVLFSGVRMNASLDPKLFTIDNKPGWQLKIAPLNKPLPPPR